ncbi:citramalyl-CoA lyase, mitochondrial [Exaiptasia diaphana]|uniref:Citramalyl-CoA lyase, mitochondrial n=1 Tax=Exaiptasia diaphana TaxID=2652724 RepID=A0A913WVG0_EXADI|nr:citramalyl-CoA lyase, mitochondrial [Exaiptasia diaphana]KXJ27828.1 Citrate lyase subunit beta-like protein, mitochondrial [Exaiptasia diaphana]
MSVFRGRFLAKILKQGFTTTKQYSRYVSGFVPRRSFLYMPGNDERKVKKATKLDADCVVLDCEDAVAWSKKQEARNIICSLLGELEFGHSEVCVRINSVSSGLAEDDLSAIFSSKVLPNTIVIPKVDTLEDMKWISEKIGSLMKPKNEKIKLITQTESAVGLLNLRDVCIYGTDPGRPFTLQAIIFGSDDFLVSIGGTRTKDALELLYARQSVVVHAKAYGLQAIDLVDIDYKDLDNLKQQSEEGARMGFTGKQIIHPVQINIVNTAFSPSGQRIQWAKELLEAFEKQEQMGKGAISFQGNMIDMPLVLQAKNVLRLAEHVKTYSS